jgi:Bacterial regulatory proteins, luxR family
VIFFDEKGPILRFFREFGVLENRANKELGDRMHISELTVKFHVLNVLAKFGERRWAGLILLCQRLRGKAVTDGSTGRLTRPWPAPDVF